VTTSVWSGFSAINRVDYLATVKLNGRAFDLSASTCFAQVFIDARRVKTSACFAVNQPVNQPALFSAWPQRRPVRLGGRSVKVYSPEESDVVALKSPEIIRCLTDLELARTDSLRVFHNGLLIAVTARTAQRVVHILNGLEPLIVRLPPYREPAETFSDLPARFADLVPRLRAWAIGDDSERIGKVTRASTKTLNHLVKRVKPRLASINRYLDRFPKGPPESAAALGTLAECTCEAVVVLEGRNRRSRKGKSRTARATR